jgi:hypothetical protein
VPSLVRDGIKLDTLLLLLLLLLPLLQEEHESGRKPPLPWNEPAAFDSRHQQRQAAALLSRQVIIHISTSLVSAVRWASLRLLWCS